jgi:anti-sigma regulatory factor (Ser/Thr protein kinase)
VPPPTDVAQGSPLRSARVQLAPDPSEVGTARRFVRSWLEGLALRPARALVDDVVLVTSELVTNAVEHGAGGPIEVVVGDDGERTVLSVASRTDAAGFELVGDGTTWELADPGSRAGRGLGIVRSLVDDVAVGRTADRLTITVTTRRDATA